MKMTFINILVICFLCIATSSCNNTNKQLDSKTASGIVIENSINYISIKTNNGDTLTYSTYELNRDSVDKVFLEDSVLVKYQYIDGIATISDIVVINHNLPFINNISAMLVGTWNNNDTTNINNPNKLIFNTDSTLEIITTDNKECLKWYIDGCNIMTHDTLSTNSIAVVRVDDNYLTISISNDNVIKFDKVVER